MMLNRKAIGFVNERDNYLFPHLWLYMRAINTQKKKFIQQRYIEGKKHNMNTLTFAKYNEKVFE